MTKITKGSGFELKSDSELVKTKLTMLDSDTAVILLKWVHEVPKR